MHNGLIISAITKTTEERGEPGTGKKGSGDEKTARSTKGQAPAKAGHTERDAKAPGGIRALDAATKGCGNVIKD